MVRVRNDRHFSHRAIRRAHSTKADQPAILQRAYAVGPNDGGQARKELTSGEMGASCHRFIDIFHGDGAYSDKHVTVFWNGVGKLLATGCSAKAMQYCGFYPLSFLRDMVSRKQY